MSISRQFTTYLAVGLLTNLSGYIAYLLITYWGVRPEMAVTLIYAVCATAAFIGNRKFTFQHEGRLTRAGYRYALAQLGGYLLNIALIEVLSNRLGFAHQLVQAGSIPVIAVFLFLVSKFYVFNERVS
ncbi:GtrA family protein [Pseudomonas sp. PDNC002]|uniref:GtrA family protein n=1 Tax=Pseudomonas sp. PDNC002 TaxID=2811422 RepID=UPI001966C642|nr:GtrA family protein [Pseudomonas sp. PDNC002]QRY81466.1 GtrA family protein [Pseudomonas sp. PDNC002]